MKIKKVIPLFAIAIGLVLALATSGFRTEKISAPDGRVVTTWFEFTGSDPTNLSQVKNYLNYTYDDGQPCSGLTNKICAVETEGTAQTGQHPAAPFSSTLQGEIEDVVNNVAPSSHVTQRQQ